MANEEHLAILNKGVEEWNAWRGEQGERPDLSGANLQGHVLQGADLRYADLSDAEFHGANLRGANLQRAVLQGAILLDANLSGASLQGASLQDTSLQFAFLHDAVLSDANLHGALLQYANLRGAVLQGAVLRGANLSGADLCDADLCDAFLQETVFANVDLSEVRGLDTCMYVGPSTADHRTLQKSGNLPIEFLRGIGFSDEFIDYIPSLFSNGIEFFSVFLSHSSTDKPFTSHLHDKLQGKGVRCWLDAHQIQPGDKIMHAIEEGIRVWDKLILVCSKESLTSWWVEDEIERALRKERKLRAKHGPSLSTLIPVDIDGFIHSDECKSAYRDEIVARNVADFRGWKDHDALETALAGLVAALRADDGGRMPPPEPRL